MIKIYHMLKRAEIVERLINEGFKHETLSSFSDYEITMLGTKIITELLVYFDENQLWSQT